MEMRVVCMSDNHGDSRSVKLVMERHADDAAAFVHCGDGIAAFRQQAQRLGATRPELRFWCVEGNCDFVDAELGAGAGDTLVEELGGHRFLVTHGDRYSVKLDLLHLRYAALEVGADVVLFGHTHCSLVVFDEGVYYVNPGSASRPRRGEPSYAIIDIDDTSGELSARIVPVE